MFTNERGGRGSVGDAGYREGGVGGFDVGAIQLKACDVDYDGKVTPDSTTPVMKVLLKPGTMSEATGTGDLHVTLTVPRMHVAAGKPLFVLGWMAPGMSQPQPVANLTVADAQGAVPLNMSAGGEAEWRPTRAVDGDVLISYRLPIDNRREAIMPSSLRIDGDGFSGSARMFLLKPATAERYRVAIRWELSAMGPGAAGMSSFGEGDLDLPAGPVSRLDESMFMAGHIKRQVEAGGFTALWLGDLPEDLHPAMSWAGQLHRWMRPFFKVGAESDYRVFLRVSKGNPGGGMAVSKSFVIGYGTGVTYEGLKSILGHEMVHTFTANDMAKWYVEGGAVYYQMLLSWRAGLRTTEQYLRDINLTAARYYTNPLIATPDDQIMAKYWTDRRLIVLPYDRGAIYFAVLNGKIRKASGGKRSVDDLVRTMVSRSGAGSPVDEAVWVGLLREALGEEGSALHKAMMSGATMLPDSDAYGPDFRRVSAKIRRFDLGFEPQRDLGQGRLVESLTPGSEADKAGIRVGDRVLVRFNTESAFRDPEMTVDAQITRDGKSFSVTYLPRGEAIDAYQWERVPGTPDITGRP
jgi:predicted metalloprotease with PDZ domain